jgi:hypothetical protein
MPKIQNKSSLRSLKKCLKASKISRFSPLPYSESPIKQPSFPENIISPLKLQSNSRNTYFSGARFFTHSPSLCHATNILSSTSKNPKPRISKFVSNRCKIKLMEETYGIIRKISKLQKKHNKAKSIIV